MLLRMRIPAMNASPLAKNAWERPPFALIAMGGGK